MKIGQYLMLNWCLVCSPCGKHATTGVSGSWTPNERPPWNPSKNHSTESFKMRTRNAETRQSQYYSTVMFLGFQAVQLKNVLAVQLIVVAVKSLMRVLNRREFGSVFLISGYILIYIKLNPDIYPDLCVFIINLWIEVKMIPYTQRKLIFV